MIRPRFTITIYHYTVDYDAADANEDPDLTTHTLGDLRDALQVLMGDHWDNLDERECEVIAYPADWQTDIRTGEVTYETPVIAADRPENLRRLMAAYDAEKRRERERVERALKIHRQWA